MGTVTSVKGILHDSAGRALSGATVMITGGTHAFNDMASVSNDSGEFYLPNIVVPGQYTLQIEGPNGSHTTTVELRDSSTIRLTL